MKQPLSATIFVDFVGKNRSYTLTQILKQSDEVKVSVIVPKAMRKQVKPRGSVSVLSTKERLTRMGQGCSCCTVRGDIMSLVRRVAADQSAQHIVIQSTADSDLKVLAKTFTIPNEKGNLLSDVARLDNVILAVDALSLLKTFETTGGRALIERLELASLIVLEGVEHLHSGAYQQIEHALQALNPEVRIMQSKDSALQLSKLRHSEPYDFDTKVQQLTSDEIFDGQHNSEEITRFKYFARRPFHPSRFHSFLNEQWKGILRVKGSFWVASQPDCAAELDIAGRSKRSSSDGKWWASVPPEERPSHSRFQEYIDNIWHPQFGDRHHALRITGVNIEETELRQRLDECLLNDEELKNSAQWADLDHPFSWPKAP